jgi:hypothetical protein
MLSRSWKKELVGRSSQIAKFMDREGIGYQLVGIGGNGIQFAIQTSQSIDNLMRSLFRAWPDVVGVQICRNEGNSRVISVVFDVSEIDANAPVGSEDDGLGESLESSER